MTLPTEWPDGAEWLARRHEPGRIVDTMPLRSVEELAAAIVLAYLLRLAGVEAEVLTP